METITKLNSIKSYINDCDFYFEYENISENLINKIYDLLINHNYDVKMKDSYIYMDMVACFNAIHSHHKRSKKIFLEQVKNENINAINNFGKFWDVYLENESEAVKYHIMSANKGNKIGMLMPDYIFIIKLLIMKI